MDDQYQYNSIIFSGTFDHLHDGHKTLLRKAAQIAKKILIGITSDQMVSHKKLASKIQPVKIRTTELKIFLREEGIRNRIEIHEINDEYGFAADIKDIEAIMISDEEIPRNNVKKINHRREAKGFDKLKVVISSYLKTKDGKKISSYDIRAKKIDRQGEPIIEPQWASKVNNLRSKNLELPPSIRGSLKHPFGKLIEPPDIPQKVIEILTNKKPKKIITVGDVVTRDLIEAGLVPDLAIIDFKTKRERHGKPAHATSHTIQLTNPAAELRRSTWDAIEQALELSGSVKIVVDGEEDLLTLPCIVLSPINSAVIYGQPDQGVVMVDISEEEILQVLNILTHFTVSRTNP